MLRKGWLAKQVRAQVSEIRYYNHYGKRDMIIKNMVAIRVISICSLLITIAFFVFSWLTGTWEVTWHFWLLFALFASTVFLSFYLDKSKTRGFFTSQLLGSLFHIILGVVLIILGVFYRPEQPSSLLNLFLIVLPIFFTTQTWIVASITLLSGTTLCVMSSAYKAPEIASYDVFTTILSMALSLVVLAYFARLRAVSFIAKEKYKRQSRTDLLTGLLNKRSYELWCQKLLEERNVSEPCALAIFDLDNFKQINDTYGHLIGDKVLEIVGQTLAENFRADGLAGRIGGDEFSAFACTREGCEFFDKRAESVVSDVKERSYKVLKIEATMSVGITNVQFGGVSYLKMFLNADRVMYDSKRSLQYERQAEGEWRVEDERQAEEQRHEEDERQAEEEWHAVGKRQTVSV